MTFVATLDAETLAAALEPVSAIVAECKLNLTEDGVEIRAVDAANVAMVSMDLDADGFEAYEASGGVIGVNLERFETVIGFADTGDLVHLELDEETRKLRIEIDGLEYTLALIDPDSIRQEPDIPDLDLAGTYVFEARELDRAITAADLCSNHIAIEARGDSELVFSAEGDTDDVVVTLEDRDLLSGLLDTDADGDAGGEGEDAGECRSLFSLDYMEDLAKPIGATTEVSLRAGHELPAMLRYSTADGDVSVLSMLAPRISSE